MRVEVERSYANGSALDAEIVFGIQILKQLYEGITPLSIQGDLFISNSKIGRLNEVVRSNRSSEIRIQAIDNTATRNDNYHFELVCVLSRKAIELIEDYRDKHRNGDVDFRIQLNVKALKSNFGVTKDVTNNEITTIFPLSLGSGSCILLKTEDTPSLGYTIQNSDWVQNYLDKFNKTQSVVLSFPQLVNVSDLSKMDGKLNVAIGELKGMRKSIDACEWYEAVQKTRPIWELLMNKEEVKNYLSLTGFNEETVKSFNELLHKSFDYASKFVHFESRGKELMVKSHVEKEDALFIYSSAVHILNLIVKKRRRSSSSNT